VRILLVAPQPFYQERGTPIAVQVLAQTLCGMGHQVDALVYHEGKDVQIPGLRLIRAGRPPGIHNVPIGISWQKLVCDLWLIAKLIKLLRKNEYDVVHAVEEAIFPAAVFNLFTRHKLVYDMDSSLADQLTDKWRPLRPLRRVLNFIERAAVRRSQVVFPVCEDLAAKVRPWVGADRVVVLPDVPVGDGPTGDVIENLRTVVGEQAVLALYVGNLERYQGMGLMLEAFAVCPAQNVHIVVIGGEAEHIKQHRERAKALGVDSRVHFLGPRPVAQLSNYLAQADILVSPRTMGTNTPMKVYSYMQAGKAILATDIRSHTQALDATCAELAAPQPAALGQGLARLAQDPELRRRLGTAARERVDQEYSLAAFKRRVQDGYRRLALA
jgi:glycosyltransferase involved in cell wall biosynthesis